MPEHFTYDYAVIRIVPRVDREEFINAGVIVSCPAEKYLEARIEVPEARLKALAPSLDIETIRTHLSAISAVCAGGPKAGHIGQLKQRERFNWLVAPRSAIIQVSPVHTGLCENPAAVLDHLMDKMVRLSIEDNK